MAWRYLWWEKDVFLPIRQPVWWFGWHFACAGDPKEHGKETGNRFVIPGFFPFRVDFYKYI